MSVHTETFVALVFYLKIENISLVLGLCSFFTRCMDLDAQKTFFVNRYYAEFCFRSDGGNAERIFKGLSDFDRKKSGFGEGNSLRTDFKNPENFRVLPDVFSRVESVF